MGSSRSAPTTKPTLNREEDLVGGERKRSRLPEGEGLEGGKPATKLRKDRKTARDTAEEQED